MQEDPLDTDGGVKSVVLTLKILEYLAYQSEPSGVTAIAQALSANKSRTFRHLRTLVQHGYITQSARTERYEAAMRLVTLGRAVSDRLSLASIGRAAIAALRDDLGHSVVLAQLEPDGLRVADNFPGKSYLELGIRRGTILSYHATAQGKLVLAFGPPEIRARVLGGTLETMNAATIIVPAELDRQIEAVRRQGWATAPNEIITGINALAAPLYDAFDTLVGTVAIFDSIQFIPEHPSEAQIQAVTGAARRISQALGCESGAPTGLGT